MEKLNHMQNETMLMNGRQVTFQRSSGKGSPLILLIHGNSLSSRIYAKQLSSPLGAKHAVVAVDLPGHGGSFRDSAGASAYGIEYFREFLCDFIHQLDYDRIILVGNSVGGNFVLQCAPKVTGLMGIAIIGTQPLFRPLDIPAAYPGNPDILGAYFRSEIDPAMLDQVFRTAFHDPDHIPAMVYEDFKSSDPALRPAILQSAVVDSKFTDEKEILENLDVPVAVFYGRSDRLTNHHFIEQLNIPRLWRGAPVIIEGAGHYAQWEAAESWNQRFEDFIAHCEGI